MLSVCTYIIILGLWKDGISVFVYYRLLKVGSTIYDMCMSLCVYACVSEILTTSTFPIVAIPEQFFHRYYTYRAG